MTWDRLRDPSPRTDGRVDEQYVLTMKQERVLTPSGLKTDQNEWQAAQGCHWRYRLQHGHYRKSDPQNECPVAAKSYNAPIGARPRLASGFRRARRHGGR